MLTHIISIIVINAAQLINPLSNENHQELQKTMEVSYCEHDPGDYPGLIDIYNYTYHRLPQCGPGQYYVMECLNDAVDTYWDQITQFNKDYRLDVCACWANHPNDPIAREECIQHAKDVFNAAVNLAKAHFILNLQSCCIALPN